MKQRTAFSLIGVALFCFGLFWSATIYKRCETISPTIKKAAGTSVLAQAIGKKELPVQKIRSPYAKDSFFILFWVLVYLEVACGLAYIAAGFALIVRILASKVFVFAAIGLDIFLKIFTSGYMVFYAAPLARLTKNENILTAYFYADSGFFDHFSGWVSGMMFFQKNAFVDIGLYVAWIGGLWYLFGRADVRAAFMKK